MDTENSVGIVEGKEKGGGTGYGGINGDGRRLDLGGEHTVWCTGDVLWYCTPETYVILLTSVILNKFNKNKK